MTEINDRIAILSDVHANHHALHSVLTQLKADNIHRIWFLGDMVGRGYRASPVAQRLYRLYQAQTEKDRQAWLSGNHDRVATGQDQAVYYGSGLNTTGNNNLAVTWALQSRQELLAGRPDLLDWLKTLPTSRILADEGIYLAHGAFMWEDTGWNNRYLHSHYVDSPGQVKAQFQSVREAARTGNYPRPRLIINGHTHETRLAIYNTVTGKSTPLPYDINGDPIAFAFNTEYILHLNPGSVGFPRQNNDAPTCAVLTLQPDSSGVLVEIRDYPFDASHYLDDVPKNYPAPYKNELKRLRKP